MLFLSIVHGTCGVANTPSVGQGVAHRHAAASTCVVADNLDVGQGMHHDSKLVGSTIDAAVGQYADRFVPAQIAGRLKILGFQVREVAVSCSRLMLHVAYQGALLNETSSQSLSYGDVATAVVADVDDEAPAKQEMGDDIIEIAFSDSRFECGAADVADVVVKDAVESPLAI